MSEQFEYKVIKLDSTDYPSTREEELNKLGKDGWEVIQILANVEGYFKYPSATIYLKRKKLNNIIIDTDSN
jgi:hypothetical protein